MITRHQQLLVAAEQAKSRSEAQLILSELNWIESWERRYCRCDRDTQRFN